ncbi:MAG: hypothetical protein NZ482_01840 [Gloeomargarita sp. SKYG98]|nr:hypothetical protein [Gloeomargarita sp. SKYG98]
MHAYGLEVLAQELVRSAPEYFNYESERGRAAILVAQFIAAGEITHVLARVAQRPDWLYSYRGGSGNLMMGWAQFNRRYYNEQARSWRYHLSSNPRTYNTLAGRIIHGLQPKPTGKGYFNLERFAQWLQSGIRSSDEILRYLQSEFSLYDWEGLHGRGARRIQQLRLGDHAVALWRSREGVALAHAHAQQRQNGLALTTTLTRDADLKRYVVWEWTGVAWQPRGYLHQIHGLWLWQPAQPEFAWNQIQENPYRFFVQDEQQRWQPILAVLG